MLEITCVEELDPGLTERVRRRFARDREALTRCGFRALCVYSETFTTRSVLFFLGMLVLMRFKREILQLRGWLTASASFELLYHTEPPAIALPLGLGVKLYTGFLDGTVLVSCTFDSEVPSSDERLVRHAADQPVAAAWLQHADRVRAMMAQGRAVDHAVTFARFVEMSAQERRASEPEPAAAAPHG